MNTTTAGNAHPGAETIFGADFDGLRVGESCESPARTISSSDVSVFAGLTGDHHPIHVDPVWAATGPFGRPIAHGLLILSCAVGMLPLEPDRVIALRRIREVVFKRPLAVGDSISVRCKVAGLRPVDEESGLVDCEWRIVDSDGKLLARAIVEILWRRGHGGEPSLLGAVASSPRRALDPDEFEAVHMDDDGVRVLI